MPLACRVQWSWVDRTGDTVKQSQRPVTSPNSATCSGQGIGRGMFVDDQIQNFPTTSKMLDCTKTWRNMLRIFFVSFYSASCLSLGDLVQRCLGQPVDLLAPWPSAAAIPRRRSTAVYFQSVERRVQRNLEGLTNVRLDELTVMRRQWLFFLVLTRRRRRLGERGDKILRRRHSNCTHDDACRRETAWVFPETLRNASRKAERPFQAQSVSHRTD